jgi:O-6-methylguanine DNA methyltransferase
VIGVSEKGLVALEFDRGHLPLVKDKSLRWEPSDKKTKPFTRELNEYFAGKRRDFTFPLDLRGTPFQLSCWRALLDIPYGETRSYADIARAVGRPQGFRAVGMANNRNPIAIVVPCHRVIASDGTLCGYGGGLDIKRKLLELEGALTGMLAA